jgi:hypothetical protein
MVLQSLSPWNARSKPLVIKVGATNLGTTRLTGLTLTLSIGFPVKSRSAYEESLTSDPTSPLFAATYAENGSIEVGMSRSFLIRQPLDQVSGLDGDWVLYPMRIELRAVDQPLATIRTPMVFVNTPPTVPLQLAWSFVLSEPMQVGPDGVFQPGPIEADIARGGRLERIAAALDRPNPPAADLAISPVLIAELETMSDGYRIVRPGGAIETVQAGGGAAADATNMLASLRRIVRNPTTEVTAMPFGDASLPAIERSGLGNLRTLLTRGATIVRDSLGTLPSQSVFRPPASALDARSFADLVGDGVETLLFDPGFIPIPAPPAGEVQFSPASVGRVFVGQRYALAVLPDPDLAALTTSYPDDPVLAAHAALGEMAATWLEAPGTPGRGVAMLFPEAATAPPQLYPALAGLVAASPWLSPERVSTFVGPGHIAPPQGRSDRLPVRRYAGFQGSYLIRLRAALTALREFRITATGPDAVAEQSTLASDLLTGEAGTFVTDPTLGLRYIDAVNGPRGAILTAYQQVAVSAFNPLTLTSRRGVLPFVVRNSSGYTMRVRVSLQADPRLRFPGGAVIELKPSLPPHSTRKLTPNVDARTTGGIPLIIRVQTIDGASNLTSTRILVRSTAYNIVALGITVAAGLFLAVWWGRGILRRRRS